ncbi:MAG: hypothetical protein ABJF23_15705 [Bryobacteraceae bacterium]
MRVDPANSSPVKFLRTHEFRDLLVWNIGKPMHESVRREKVLPPARIPDQQFTVNQIVPGGFVVFQ